MSSTSQEVLPIKTMTMDKAFSAQAKQQLEEEQAKLKEQLGKIATKDPKVAGDYDAKFPQYTDTTETESGDFDDSAHEVQDYADAIGVENTLELRLQKVEEALGRIESGSYGVCSNCKAEQSKERLEADFAADTCPDCAGA